MTALGFPGGADGKESSCSAGDPGSIPGSGRSPGEGNGNPLQCSCLEDPMDRGAWQATVHGVTKSRTRLSFELLNFFWTSAHQASLSFSMSQSLLKLTSIESVMPSNHLILCCSLLLLPSIFPSIRISSKADFSRVSCLHQVAEYWSFSFSISPSNEYSGLISFRIGSFDLRVVQGILICYILQMLYVTYNTYNIIYNIHIEYVTYPYI